MVWNRGVEGLLPEEEAGILGGGGERGRGRVLSGAVMRQ